MNRTPASRQRCPPAKVLAAQRTREAETWSSTPRPAAPGRPLRTARSGAGPAARSHRHVQASPCAPARHPAAQAHRPLAARPTPDLPKDLPYSLCGMGAHRPSGHQCTVGARTLAVIVRLEIVPFLPDMVIG